MTPFPRKRKQNRCGGTSLIRRFYKNSLGGLFPEYTFVDTAWPAYPDTHLAGLMGGLFCITFTDCARENNKAE